MAIAQAAGLTRKIYHKVDETYGEAKLHALSVFRSALSEPLVRKELQEHPDLELSRMLGIKKKRGVELDKAFARNVLDASFVKKLVPSDGGDGIDEALIVRATLKNGDEIRLTTTSGMFELAVYDKENELREAIRQTGRKLELIKGANPKFT